MDSSEQLLHKAGLPSSLSATAEHHLRLAEERIGNPLPAAFRRFMALEGAGEFLGRFRNDDHPIGLAELGLALPRWHGYDPLSEQILPFMRENQDVCVWGIWLNGSDDPPIVVDVDSGSPPKWELCADSFTNWLACQFWDWGHPEWSFAANGRPLDQEVLSSMRQHFDEGLQTWAWPGKVNYRFINGRSKLLVWSGEDQCDWWLAPTAPDFTFDALDEIERIAGIGAILYALGDQFESVLDEWRRARC
jgi:hypothetical protein